MAAKKIRYIVGRSKKYGWVTVDLNLNPHGAPENIDSSDGAWGRALAILWQHEALEKVALLEWSEWFEHKASNNCAISHIDLGLEVMH